MKKMKKESVNINQQEHWAKNLNSSLRQYELHQVQRVFLSEWGITK